MNRDEVYVGQRVCLTLPDKSAIHRYRAKHYVTVNGTVTALDEVPGYPGVRVQRDRRLNGADNCYATYAEL